MPKLSGFIDTTYNFNFNDPMDGVNVAHFYTARTNTFLLNNAHVALTGSNETVSYAVELDIGTDASYNRFEVAAGEAPVIGFDLQEAWMAYVSSGGLGFKAGKLISYEGIEVFESGSNPTISRGLLFTFAEPVSHTGVLLTYQINKEFDVAAGVVNGWDVAADNNKGKTFLAKIGYVGENALLTVSGLAGPEQAGNNDDWRLSADATGMVKVGSMDVWAQVNYGSEDGLAPDGGKATWYGVGLQPLWHVNEKFALGLRGELLKDADGARTGTEDLTYYNVTVTPAYTLIPSLVLRGEVRFDVASEDVFQDSDGAAQGNQTVALAEAVYSF